MNTPIAARFADFAAQTPPALLDLVDLLLKVTVLLVVGLAADCCLRRRRPLAAITLWNALLAAVVALPAAHYALPKAQLLPNLNAAAVEPRATVGDRPMAAEEFVLLPPAPSAVPMSGPPIVPGDTWPANTPPAAGPPSRNDVARYAKPVVPSPSVAPHTSVDSASALASAPSVDQSDAAVGLTIAPSGSQPAAEEMSPAGDSPSVVAIPGLWLYVAAGLYGIGLLIAAGRLAAALWGVFRMRRRSAPLLDDDWRRRLRRWAERLQLDAARIELRTSAAVNVPLVVGRRRPAVVIPLDIVAAASPTARDAVLAHELAHVARADYGWQLLLRVLQTVLWFHPLIWYVERRIHYVRERVCDAYGVHGLGDAEQYADVLLEMASRLAKRCRLGLGLAVVRSSKLGERLSAIYERGGDARCAPSRLGRSLAAGVALTAAGLLGSAALAQVAGRPSSRPAAQSEAAGVIERFRAEAAEQAVETVEQMRKLQEQTIARLKSVQEELTRGGKLDEAVAVREQIRILESHGISPVTTTHSAPYLRDAEHSINAPGVVRTTETRPAPLPDPDSLTSYNLRLGEQFDFQVTGSADGSIWGTDLYSHDSTLAKAAVHAGVLAVGQAGVVRVTMLKGPPTFRGTSRHGVTSDPWPNESGAYSAFRVERADVGVLFTTPAGARTVVAPLVGVVTINPAAGGLVTTDPTTSPLPSTAYVEPRGPTTAMPASPQPILDDPGTMSNHAHDFGRVFPIRVTAAADGPIWGTDCFTHDSDLSTAALHVGVLRAGQTGVLGVLVERGPTRFVGSRRNGVESYDWDNSSGHYAGYRFVSVTLLGAAGPTIAPPIGRTYAARK